MKRRGAALRWLEESDLEKKEFESALTSILLGPQCPRAWGTARYSFVRYVLCACGAHWRSRGAEPHSFLWGGAEWGVVDTVKVSCPHYARISEPFLLSENSDASPFSWKCKLAKSSIKVKGIQSIGLERTIWVWLHYVWHFDPAPNAWPA